MFLMVFDHSTFYLDGFGYYYNNRAICPDLFAMKEDLRRFSYAKSLDRTPVESSCESAHRFRWFAVNVPWFLYAQYHLMLIQVISAFKDFSTTCLINDFTKPFLPNRSYWVFTPFTNSAITLSSNFMSKHS